MYYRHVTISFDIDTTADTTKMSFVHHSGPLDGKLMTRDLSVAESMAAMRVIWLLMEAAQFTYEP